MAITSGTRLGSYEVSELIGAGGMGEVYKARDTKLGRDVAIKVLPEAFSQDKERLARFEREARLLASLNHPNIAAIYGIEESDGVCFLVLELVPGETLSERIARGPVPLDDALPLYVQIAEALEAAHEKGIIHRDLKPANVKVTPEGKVKVLDFGLAKAFGDEQAASDLSQSPTMTRDATQAGVILGTAAYMSPEQARGKTVDKRSDIWSFGCCLFEALTGRKAFDGETITDIFAKILEREPEWRSLPGNVPALLRSLLHRCLEKDPERRLHDVADARIEMEECLREPYPHVLEAATPQRRSRLLSPLVTGLLTALVVGFAVWALTRSGSPDSPPLKRFSITLPEPVQLATSVGLSLVLSPDGRDLIFVGRREGIRQLYLRRMDSMETSPLDGTDGAQSPFFSPDGRWVGFSAGGELKKVPLSGGSPLTLCEAPPNMWGASWGSDGAIVFSSGRILRRISADGGEPEEIYESEEEWLAGPKLLAGGKVVLYTSASEVSSIAALSLESGERRILVQDGRSPQFVPTGHIVFARSGGLWSIPFDVERHEVPGPPVPLLEEARSGWSWAHFTLGNDGSLVYVPTGRPADRTLVLVDRQGNSKPLIEGEQFSMATLSPDGRRVAVSIGLQGFSDIWLYEIERGGRIRLTTDGLSTRPLWTPNGNRIAFASRRSGSRSIYWKLADGSGEAELLLERAGTNFPNSWSSDGRFLAFSEPSAARDDRDIWVLPLEGDRNPLPFLTTSFNERSPIFSPDGGWLAYVSNESGRDEVYLQSYPGPGGKLPISTDGGTMPIWSVDGREIFYRNGDQMLAVNVETEPELHADKPRVLFEGQFVVGPNAYDVTSDSQNFIMIEGDQESAITELHVVLNWFEELKRIVPTDE